MGCLTHCGTKCIDIYSSESVSRLKEGKRHRNLKRVEASTPTAIASEPVKEPHLFALR